MLSNSATTLVIYVKLAIAAACLAVLAPPPGGISTKEGLAQLKSTTQS